MILLGLRNTSSHCISVFDQVKYMMYSLYGVAEGDVEDFIVRHEQHPL